jgi:uncharacterized protein (TIGR03032 family)
MARCGVNSGPLTATDLAAGFTSRSTESFRALLHETSVSLVITTYQTGKLAIARDEGERVNTHWLDFDRPMGVAAQGDRLVLGIRAGVWEYGTVAEAAERAGPPHDACYLPRCYTATGDVRIHDIAIDRRGHVWFANTRFSCLSTLCEGVSFVPEWRPSFITALAPEDRCHLNGLAMVDGAPGFVTAFGRTDALDGWRANASSGGVALHVPSGEVVAGGLCMPHSPRWHDGCLWVLESGKGELACVDVETGRAEAVASLPGFTRGLSIVGRHAFVGVSCARDSLFDGAPIKVNGQDACGVWVVDIEAGTTVGYLRFGGVVKEIGDVLALGRRWPEIVEVTDPRVLTSYVTP